MEALLLRYRNLQEVGAALRQDRQPLLFCAEGGVKYVPLEDSQLLPDYTGPYPRRKDVMPSNSTFFLKFKFLCNQQHKMAAVLYSITK
jgi:hypothetical protein